MFTWNEFEEKIKRATDTLRKIVWYFLHLSIIWKIDGFAWMFVCVSLNLVTYVFFI